MESNRLLDGGLGSIIAPDQYAGVGALLLCHIIVFWLLFADIRKALLVTGVIAGLSACVSILVSVGPARVRGHLIVMAVVYALAILWVRWRRGE